MKKLLLLLLITPVISKAQNLKDLVPKKSIVYVQAQGEELTDFAKERLYDNQIFTISNVKEKANFFIKFNIINTSTSSFSGYVDFNDKSGNTLYSTKSVNSDFAFGGGFLNARKNIIQKLINKRIIPEYKKTTR